MREMKDSGIPWIGEIPKDWNLTRIKYTCKNRSEKAFFNHEKDKYLGLENVIGFSDRIIETDTTYTDGYYDIYRNGDILFNKLRPYLGKVIIANQNGFCTGEFIRLFDYRGDNKFLRYWMINEQFINEVNNSTYGAKMPRANPEFIMNMSIPVIPYEQQHYIANYLDSKCAKIDSIKKNVEAEIEALKQYKKSVITEAVTKGLNKDVEMKDSGIPWIGEIPKNWKTSPIKYICKHNSIKIGPFGSALANKTFANEKYNVYGQANLVSGNFSATKNTITKKTFNDLKNYEVLPGDICVSMMGTIGKCRIVPLGVKQGIMDSHLIKLRVENAVMLPKFFLYVYDKNLGGVCFKQMQYEKTGSIMDGLNTSIVKRLHVTLPPIKEQQRIVNFLDIKCTKVDSIIQKKQEVLQKLDTYKKSLIYEYVTGKKEVPAV